ncbi:MAG: Ig-like domain-containing protein [Gammaproteobacteria bacterium]|nr:Ig-like domain-containing protein [Gammaproteobacteria bacterium]
MKNHTMQNTTRINIPGMKFHFLLMFTVIALLLSGCAQQTGQEEVQLSNDRLSAPLPRALRALDNESNLVVEVVINGEAPKVCANLAVDKENATFSCDITVSAGPHTLSLIYSIIDPTYEKVKVAITSSIEVKVVEGEAAAADFSSEVMTYEDSDNDGINNLDELNAGTDPNVSLPIATPQNITLTENTKREVTLAGSQAENRVLTYTVVTLPENGGLSGTAPNLLYTPKSDYTGDDSFTFKVNDGVADSELATVKLTIKADTPKPPTPIPPTATPQGITLAENTKKKITLTGSQKENKALKYAVVTQPENGALSGTAPDLIYTPKSNYSGDDSFTFKVNDGANDSELATVKLTIKEDTPKPPTPIPPTATPQDITLTENTKKKITLTGSQAKNRALTYAVVTPPKNGKLSGTAPSLLYTPKSDYTGDDSFTFKVNDGANDSELATIKLAIKADKSIKQPPIATPQSITFAKNTSRAITLAGNDAGNDAGNKALTYAVVTPPKNGKLSGTAPNLLYTPESADYAGDDSFTFKVNNGTDDSAPATVKLTIKTYMLLEKREDYDGDGTADVIRTYTYDANGNELTNSYDGDGNGTADTIFTSSYDAKGNRLTYSRDEDGDGTVDSTSALTYDANGNRLTESYDANGDGTAERIETFTYDAKGNLLTYSRDEDGDGTAEKIETYTYTYDANGNALTASFDDGGSTADSITTFTYDANDNRLTISYDFDGNGTVDRVYTDTYDANGKLLTESFDEDGDGAAERIDTYTYDANGNRLTESSDEDGDGTADRIDTYTYDDNGNQLTYSRDEGGDGTADRIDTYTYDDNGNQLAYSRDEDGDGTVDSTSALTYDANGNRLTESSDEDGDGTAERIDTYTWGEF